MRASSDEITLGDLAAEESAEIIAAKDEQIRGLREALHQTQVGRAYDISARTKGNTIRFGLWSDPHFGSRYCRHDALDQFYNLLRKEKVRIALAAGDILDGHGQYPGQEFEQTHVGLARQLDALRQLKPDSRGVETYFITGNHDYSFFKGNGAEPWNDISLITGWRHVGIDSGTVNLETEKGHRLRVGLIHPDGGTAYALSYRAQKLIEAIPGGQKPDVFAIGHYHKAEYIPRWRNVAAFQAGAFQSQTPFMKRKASDSHVGGWIIEAVMSERKTLTASVGARFVSYYEPEE